MIRERTLNLRGILTCFKSPSHRHLNNSITVHLAGCSVLVCHCSYSSCNCDGGEQSPNISCSQGQFVYKFHPTQTISDLSILQHIDNIDEFDNPINPESLAEKKKKTEKEHRSSCVANTSLYAPNVGPQSPLNGSIADLILTQIQ